MSVPQLCEFKFDGPLEPITQKTLKPVYEEYQQFRFLSVDAWPELHDIVDLNSRGLDAFGIPYDTDANSIVRLIAKQLRIHYKHRFHDQSRMYVVRFSDQDSPYKAIMCGHHYYTELNRLDDNRTLHEVMIQSPEKLDPDKKRYFCAIQALLAEMLIRDVSYGYIATPEKMRAFYIFKPSGPDKGSLVLKVSPAIVSSERYRVVLGLTLHVHHKPPFLNHEAGVFVDYLQTTDPPVWKPGAKVATPSPSKHWKKDGVMRFRAHKLCCHSRLGPPKPVPGFIYGVLRTDVQNETARNSVDRAYSPVVLKHASVIDPVAFKALEREAMMYEYLMSKQCAFVPTRLLYGKMLDSIKILCLEPYGRQLEASDFPDVIVQIREALSALHQLGIIHGCVKVETFYKKADRVMVTNFHKSRLYEVVPTALAQAEMSQASQLCVKTRL